MYKLLLVDDEEIIREGIRSMVDWERLNIVVTASCPDAIAALDSMMDNMPDIIMTDVRMPGINGLELTERAMSLHPQVQTLILSGYDEFEYARRAMKYGVTEYLLKPCTQEEMEAALERACRAIDRERLRVVQLSGERQVRVRLLVGVLNELQSGMLDGAQLERQVGEIAKTAEDPSLLREALISMLTRGVSPSQSEWGFSVIRDAQRDPGQLAPLIVRALLRLREESSDMRGFVQKMVAYVDEHYGDETLSLQYLADHVVYMNADYIGREFTRDMGRKFSSYLLEVRMEHAKALMAQDLSLRSYEIAGRIGLGSNPHYFSQVFRKYTGSTTKEYRAKMEHFPEK